jgi:hypothetical protein
MSEPRFGDCVRVTCGATGRYLQDGLALYVSAQDNDLCVDEVDLGVPPHPSLPVPNDDALSGASVGLSYRRRSS